MVSYAALLGLFRVRGRRVLENMKGTRHQTQVNGNPPQTVHVCITRPGGAKEKCQGGVLTDLLAAEMAAEGLQAVLTGAQMHILIKR